MYQRDHDRGGAAGQSRPDAPLRRRSVNPVLALQGMIGNRGTTQLLARDKANKRKQGSKGKNRPSFEHSVRIGKLGPIEIKGGNIAEWAAKKNPEGLKVISPKGKHSDELKRLFDSKARIDTVETDSVVGENTLVTITFKECHIRRYSSDGENDEWTVEFETAARQSVSIGTAR